MRVAGPSSQVHENERGESFMVDNALSAQEVRDTMRMRESVYRLLSSLYFKELTIEQIRFLASQDYSGMEDLNPHIAEGLDDIRRYLHRVNSGTREDLAVDYAHTFLAAGSSKEESRACPYESVFTSRDGLIMQEARDDVYRYMLAEHLEPDENLRIPEDHIAFVFEFMANLCARYCEADEAGNHDEAVRLFEVQRAFFDAHIGGWIHLLCDAIEGCCRTRFYAGVSKVTRGFVEVERGLLAEMDEALNGTGQGPDETGQGLGA